MNELEELPSYSQEDARCWKCGSTTYRGGESDPKAMEQGILKVISCTDCRPGGEVELEKALGAVWKKPKTI
jgi:hypothetical protein